MTQEQIYKIALLCFNISYDKIKDTPDDMNLLFCDTFLRSAELAVIDMYDWSFLQERYKYDKSERITYEKPFDDMEYIYYRPSDMAKPLFVNGTYDNDIRMIGDTIIFKVPDPELTYLKDRIDYKSFPYPEGFGFLLGYQLAYEICDMIMPEKDAFKRGIVAKVQEKASLLRSADIEGNRDKNPEISWIKEENL